MWFRVVAVEQEDPAHVEHSAAPPNELWAIGTSGYNFRGKKKPERRTIREKE
jgi:hypothetical protein